MRIIKVKKTSGKAVDADLDDSFSIEVGELEAKNTPATDGNSRQGKRRHKTNEKDELFDLFGDPVAVVQKQSRKSKENKSFYSPDKSSVDDVYNRGIYLLSMREYSVKELSDKLKQKFPTSSEVEIAVQRLLDNDYVSDRRFTEAYARQRGNRGLGPMKIRAELYKKGIKNNLIDEYLDVESAHWLDSALAQYNKKFGDSKVEDYKDWARRARFLQGRGYSSKHIEHSVPDISD